MQETKNPFNWLEMRKMTLHIWLHNFAWAVRPFIAMPSQIVLSLLLDVFLFFYHTALYVAYMGLLAFSLLDQLFYALIFGKYSSSFSEARDTADKLMYRFGGGKEKN